MMFTDSTERNDYYNTDVRAYIRNLEHIEHTSNTHVVIAPGYMVYTQDFDELLQTHMASGADITVLYQPVDNAKDAYQNCYCVNLNRQKGVTSFEKNSGTAKNRNIFMDTYVMKKEVFVELLHEAARISSMYTLRMIVNEKCNELDIRGVAHRGFFAPITDFKSYYAANMELLDLKTANSLFHEDWPIYTRTNDSCPTQYFDTANVKSSFMSNGCEIEGTVENSVIGRGCIIKRGAVVKNCVVLTTAVIGEGVHIEGQVVDKNAQVIHRKEIISDPAHPGYIRRCDKI
jgi:glucose-1-phosphate adenylyltransferase